jgi:hypothetical protein
VQGDPQFQLDPIADRRAFIVRDIIIFFIGGTSLGSNFIHRGTANAYFWPGNSAWHMRLSSTRQMMLVATRSSTELLFQDTISWREAARQAGAGCCAGVEHKIFFLGKPKTYIFSTSFRLVFTIFRFF